MRLVFCLLGLLCLTPLAGCGGNGGGDASAQKRTTLVYGRGGDADILDPVLTSSGETVKVLVNVFDTLVAYDDETLEIVPSLAERWETSDDGLTWTFHLRPQVTFHDGSPLDAEAIKFNFARLLKKGFGYRAHYAPIASVTVQDELTVVFQLKYASPVFLNNLAMFPASICSPQAVRQDEAAFGFHPVGTGPFKFQSWTPKQKLVLEANTEYWRGPPGVDRVIFLPIDESAIRVKQLERGEIHIADNLPPSELDVLATRPGVVLQSLPGMNVGYLAMQNEKPPLNNKKVRQAIWFAIDKRRLCEVTYSGHARPAFTLVPPTVFAHHTGLQDRPYDIARAKKLLAEAAREDGFALPLKMQLFAMQQPRPYMQQPRQTALVIRDSLEKIGIDLTITTIDLRQYWQRLSRGEHELALAGWTSDNNDPDNFLYALLDPDNINDQGGNNLSRYNNAEVHRRLIAAQRELDPAVRKRLYFEAQEIIFDDAPVVPLVHTDQRVALRAEVQGYKIHPSTLVRLRLARFQKKSP